MSERRERVYPDTWRLMAHDYDPNDHLMKLKAKDYLDVQNRMVWFIRDQRALIVAGVATQPYAVTTALVELDREAGWAHFRTTVRDVLGNEATAYGSESVKDFGDYIEKAATKSLGRALIGLGYGTQFAPEISEGEGERPVDSPVTPAPSAQLHNYRAEQAASGHERTQTPQNARSTATPPPGSPRPANGPSGGVTDERVTTALRNRTVLSLLTDLGVVDQAQRRAKVAESFAAIDRRPGVGAGAATVKQLMDGLEAAITKKRTAEHETAKANGHDLQASGAFAGPMPN